MEHRAQTDAGEQVDDDNDLRNDELQYRPLFAEDEEPFSASTT